MRFYVRLRVKRIYEIVRLNPGITPKGIAFALDLPAYTVYKALQRMNQDRRVQKRSSEDRRKTHFNWL